MPKEHCHLGTQRGNSDRHWPFEKDFQNSRHCARTVAATGEGVASAEDMVCCRGEEREATINAKSRLIRVVVAFPRNPESFPSNL